MMIIRKVLGMGQGGNTTVTLAIIAFACLCVVSVAGLIVHGNDPSQLVYFITGFVPVTVGVILANRKIDNVSQTVDSIHTEVNGHMTERIQGAVTAVNEHTTETVNGTESGAAPNAS